MVVAMARNGTEFGVQVAGTGDRWFTGPVAPPRGAPDGAPSQPHMVFVDIIFLDPVFRPGIRVMAVVSRRS